MSQIILYLSIAIISYIYVLYPIAIYLFSKVYSDKTQEVDSFYPSVCILIAAYNEEKYVLDKINNSLEQMYPKDKLKVILVSDGSTDRTLELANSISHDVLKVINVEKRQGKANAINTALTHINEEVIVFTDANVFLHDNAVRELVKPLQDDNVACVSGRVMLKAINDGEILGEGLYMKYERLMFKSESIISTMTGIDGGMFAIKREFVEPISKDTILDDMLIAMRVLLNKKKIKYKESAVAEEYVPASVAQEFRRKVRIATGAFQLLTQVWHLLLPWHQFSIFVFFVSHKVLRWLSPLFLLLILAMTLLKIDEQPFLLLFEAQLVFYFVAILGQFSEKLRNFSIVYVAYYFTVVNISMFIGLLKYLSGKHSVKWNKVNR